VRTRFAAALVAVAVGSLGATDARAEWKPVKQAPADLGCSTEMFGQRPQTYIWKNGNALLAICTSAPLPPKMPVSLAANFQILFVLGDSQTELATETEVSPKPRRVRIAGDDVEITRFYNAHGGPSLTREVIHCTAGNCERQPPTCALETPKNGKATVDALERALSVSRPEQKLAVWKDWFFSGKHLKEGGVVLVQAMLGDRRAAELITGDVGADGGPGEVQGQLGDDIEDVAKVCSLAK